MSKRLYNVGDFQPTNLIWDSTLPKDLRKQYQYIAERNKIANSPKKKSNTIVRELRKESARPEEGRETNETTILVSKECREMMSEDGQGETDVEALSKTNPHSLQSSHQRIMSAKMSQNRNSYRQKARYAHADYTQE